MKRKGGESRRESHFLSCVVTSHRPTLKVKAAFMSQLKGFIVPK